MADMRFSRKRGAEFETTQSRMVALLLCATLPGCQGISISKDGSVGFFVDLSGAATHHIDTYSVGENHPPIDRFVGAVYGYSCQMNRSDTPATRADALIALKLEAVDRGANAIVDVAYDLPGQSADSSDCLEIISVSGNAVVLAD